MYKIDENSEEYIQTHPDVAQRKAPTGELESRALRQQQSLNPRDLTIDTSIPDKNRNQSIKSQASS